MERKKGRKIETFSPDLRGAFCRLDASSSSPRGGVVAHGHASNAGDSIFVAFPPDFTHAVHGHHSLSVGHLVLAELDHPVPDLGLAPAGEQNVDLIETELAVEQQCILLFGPVAVEFPVVFHHEAGRIGSRRRKRSWLVETGRLSPVWLYNLIK